MTLVSLLFKAFASKLYFREIMFMMHLAKVSGTFPCDYSPGRHQDFEHF